MSRKYDNMTDSQRKLIKCLPASCSDLARELDTSEATVRNQIMRIRERLDGNTIVYHRGDNEYRAARDFALSNGEEQESGELSQREEYILTSLPATVQELSDDIGIQENIVEAYIENISEKGHHIQFDERTDTYHSNESPELRSSEHIGKRTRAANQWWQKKHDELIRNFRALSKPSIDIQARAGNQDFVSHITDLHMGDRVYDDSGKEVYNTKITQDVIRYITRKQLQIYETHSQLVDFDCWHEIWGGDFITNEAIYEGQFEDLDAWLDEQHDAIVEPLLERLKAISEKSESVNIVCKTGNHGEHRASGKSRQANADLILYKHLRNTVAQLQNHADLLENVEFKIGSSRPYKNFEMRDGKLTGHLRHGQNRKAGYRTSAAQKEWNQTLLNHDFDVGYTGHVHRGQRFHVNGNPVYVTGTPKPAGKFAGRIAAGDDTNIALSHGVNDQGTTFEYPIDLRDFGQSGGF
jgi:DNA-binding CsgD family transcriptional regulator